MYTINLNQTDQSIDLRQSVHEITLDQIGVPGERGQIGNGADELVVNGKSSDYQDHIDLVPSDFTHVVLTKVTNYLATATDDVIRFTATATLSLPHATCSGRRYTVICDGAGVIVTIDANASETINNELTQILNDGDTINIIDVALNKWNII